MVSLAREFIIMLVTIKYSYTLATNLLPKEFPYICMYCAPLFYCANQTTVLCSDRHPPICRLVKNERHIRISYVNKNIYIARQYTYRECTLILSVPSFSFNYCINSSRQDLEGELSKPVETSFQVLHT